MSSERWRQNAERLIQIAKEMHHWSTSDVSAHIGRDPSRLIPASGLLKADVLMRLAKALESDVDTVTRLIYGGGDEAPNKEVLKYTELSYDELFDLAHSLQRNGDFSSMLNVSKALLLVGETPDERACAHLFESVVWQTRGRHRQEVESLSTAMRIRGVSAWIRQLAQANMANAYFLLRELHLAVALGTEVIDWYRQRPIQPTDRSDNRTALAIAHAARSNAIRVIGENDESRMQEAVAGLKTAAALFVELAIEREDDRFSAMASTCDAGRLEMDVSSGRVEVQDAMGVVRDVLGSRDHDDLCSDWTETMGWWCECGASIAIDHLPTSEVQATAGRFASTATSLASKIDNWALRERALLIRYRLHERLRRSSGLELDLTLDERDRGMIVHLITRFPRFEQVGRYMLECGRFAGGSS